VRTIAARASGEAMCRASSASPVASTASTVRANVASVSGEQRLRLRLRRRDVGREAEPGFDRFRQPAQIFRRQHGGQAGTIAAAGEVRIDRREYRQRPGEDLVRGQRQDRPRRGAEMRYHETQSRRGRLQRQCEPVRGLDLAAAQVHHDVEPRHGADALQCILQRRQQVVVDVRRREQQRLRAGVRFERVQAVAQVGDGHDLSAVRARRRPAGR
jgi:hypothetical protein